jgi:biotin synthase
MDPRLSFGQHKENNMHIQQEVMRIVFRAQEGTAPTKADCLFLLDLPEDSIEAGFLKIAADAISREKFGNQGIILGQIGVETSPCPGGCKFCSFGEDNTNFPKYQMPDDEILRRAAEFTGRGDLFALFLMTMHEFNFEHLLRVVTMLKKVVQEQVQIVVNIGDFDRVKADELRDAGVRGAYHVLRLREGIDTKLNPEARGATMQIIRDAGLDFYYCCEPIGPEHTTKELVDQIFVGIEIGCFQHAAMRRVYVPSSPLAHFGQITERRLAQVVAVVSLATVEVKETQSIAVHEPNLLGLVAGANTVYAETGANPRDTAIDTTGHRGLDMSACRKMLYEAGFASLLARDGTTQKLDHLSASF